MALPECILMNPLCRVALDHTVHSWSASTPHPQGMKVHPQLIRFLRGIDWPISIQELQSRFVTAGIPQPAIVVDRLMELRVLIGLEEHASNLATLKGQDELDLAPFLLNEYSVMYFRAALRLGLGVIAQDPATIEISSQTTRHIIHYAGLVTLEADESVQLSRQKDLCTAKWRNLGLPVPREVVLPLDRLQEAPERVGFPLVIKPITGAMGRGVFANVNSPAEIARIQEHFASKTRGPEFLLVQEFVPGTDHRLLVVNGRVTAAARRLCPFVLGDGSSTIRQLLDGPTVGERFSFTESGTVESMRCQGLTPETILPVGRKAVLNNKSNHSTGGIWRSFSPGAELAEAVHPTVQAAACRATEAIGLQVAGVDFICEDAILPLAQGRGCLIEINTHPGVEASETHDILRHMFRIQ